MTVPKWAISNVRFFSKAKIELNYFRRLRATERAAERVKRSTNWISASFSQHY